MPTYAVYLYNGIVIKSCIPRYWHCHQMTFLFSYTRGRRRHKQVFMLIITRRKRLLKQDSHLWCKYCILKIKGSYVIEYQLFQTCALINCNHVYFLMKLVWISKEKHIITIICRPIMLSYNIYVLDIFVYKLLSSAFALDTRERRVLLYWKTRNLYNSLHEIKQRLRKKLASLTSFLSTHVLDFLNCGDCFDKYNMYWNNCFNLLVGSQV